MIILGSSKSYCIIIVNPDYYISFSRKYNFSQRITFFKNNTKLKVQINISSPNLKYSSNLINKQIQYYSRSNWKYSFYYFGSTKDLAQVINSQSLLFQQLLRNTIYKGIQSIFKITTAFYFYNKVFNLLILQYKNLDIQLFISTRVNPRRRWF